MRVNLVLHILTLMSNSKRQEKIHQPIKTLLKTNDICYLRKYQNKMDREKEI